MFAPGLPDILTEILGFLGFGPRVGLLCFSDEGDGVLAAGLRPPHKGVGLLLIHDLVGDIPQFDPYGSHLLMLDYM